MRPLLGRVGISLALIGLIAFPLGCKKVRRVCGPSGCGKIVGHVIGAEGPLEDVEIRAYPRAQSNRIRVPVEQSNTRTDDKGQFSLHLPAGPYWLSVILESEWESCEYSWSASGPVGSMSDAETIHAVGGDWPVRADFVFGGMEIRTVCPPELGRCSIRCFVQQTGEHRHARQTDLVPNDESILFDTLPPGTYLVRTEVWTGSPRALSCIWLTSGITASRADTFVVLARETTLAAARLPEPGYVRGRVYGWWREAGDYSRIILHALDEEPEVAHGWIGDSGEFSIPVFAAGTVRLSTSIGGPRRWYGGTCFEDADVLKIEPGTEVWVDSIGVSCLSYEIHGSPEWEPPAARLSFYDSTGTLVFSRERVRGWPLSAPLCGLAPGTYFVSIKPTASQGWRPQWYDRAATREEATPIVIASETDRVDVTITLEEGGKVRGRILDTEGRSFRRLVCASVPEFHWHPDEMWWTDSTGYFLMEGLPDGDIKIGATGWNHCVDVTWYPGTKDPDSAEVIRIENAATLEGFEWTLLPRKQ